MKRRLIMGFIILIMVLGIGLMAYPSLANFINNQFSISTIGDYNTKVEKYNKEEIDKIMKNAYDYNNSLPGAFPADPFSGKNISRKSMSDFKDFFMVQEGAMIGYIEIPSVDIYLPIYYGTSDAVLKKGVGLIKNSSLPVAGESSHALLSAHTGLPSQELFTGIEELKDGDVFFIHIMDQVFAYRINQRKVVLPEETSDLMIEEGKTYITLITCTPYGINTHRLLVRGEYDPNFDFSSEEYTFTSQKHKNDWLWIILVSGFIVVGIVGFIIFKKKKKESKKEEN
ncbi:class C sortase [Clostridium paraputrificum]|uniref:class C sortase n=1 Tax=Clostridium paraputrificum TaxID=29363 RepID=UPI002FCDA7C4